MISIMKKQALLAELKGLSQACPDGVLISPTMGDVSLWTGVIFVRKGPYKNGVFRFSIHFPDTFPATAPSVTFTTDIFHPLVAPLSRYTETGVDGTSGSKENQRLPPGGFSLRHGFPKWFPRAKANETAATQPGRMNPSLFMTPAPEASKFIPKLPPSRVSIYEILLYIRRTFDSASLLNEIPYDAAGNPGAWLAWRAYQQSQGIAFPDSRNTSPSAAESRRDECSEEGDSEAMKAVADTKKNPEDWSWDGVWQSRVKKGINDTLSDLTLYGAATSEDVLLLGDLGESVTLHTVPNKLY